MAKSARDIPASLQPRNADWPFDLDNALHAIVAIRADVPEDASTAGALGTERSGSAVAIPGGLVLTMGYLILEAESIWLTTSDGRVVPGHALAIDFETGFGLIQPFTSLKIPELPLGDPQPLAVGAPLLLAGAGGRQRTIETRLVGRQEFAGYWEYLIEDALFTAPAHPFWGGAGLIGEDGKLLGIASLILQQGEEGGRRTDMNMVVPVSLLTPVLDELRLFGRTRRPARPWLGLFALESDDTVVIGGVAEDGPADRAGLRTGDRVLAVDGEEVNDLATLWRRIWSAGTAGARVRLAIGRAEQRLQVTVHSVDRVSMLRAPRMH